MKKARRIAFILAVLGCSDTADTVPDRVPPRGEAPANVNIRPARASCGLDSGAALTGDGIGDLRIGASVAELSARCRIARDSVIPLREGAPERVLVVRLAADTVRALIEDDEVTLLFVHTPSFRTRAGLGVGSTIGALRAAGPGTVSREEGTHIKLRDVCGLVFYPEPLRAPLRATLAELPADAEVERVVVAGCGPAARYYRP